MLVGSAGDRQENTVRALGPMDLFDIKSMLSREKTIVQDTVGQELTGFGAF